MKLTKLSYVASMHAVTYDGVIKFASWYDIQVHGKYKGNAIFIRSRISNSADYENYSYAIEITTVRVKLICKQIIGRDIM